MKSEERTPIVGAVVAGICLAIPFVFSLFGATANAVRGMSPGGSFTLDFLAMLLAGYSFPSTLSLLAAIGIAIYLHNLIRRDTPVPVIGGVLVLIVLWFGSMLIAHTHPDLNAEYQEIKSQQAEEEPGGWQDRI